MVGYIAKSASIEGEIVAKYRGIYTYRGINVNNQSVDKAIAVDWYILKLKVNEYYHIKCSDIEKVYPKPEITDNEYRLPKEYKLYKCTDCNTINVKRILGDPSQFFCDECKRPLWD